MSKKVLVPLAKGFEEIEAVSIIDVLRRAGIEVVVASISKDLEVIGANNITIKADRFIEGITSDDIDMIVLPGGWDGTYALADDLNIQVLLKNMNGKDKLIGAICAAPFVLDTAGVLKNNYTCYPSVEEKIATNGYSDKNQVVIDNNIVTSRGPGTAICFGLAIVKQLVGEDSYNQLKAGLLADFCE